MEVAPSSVSNSRVASAGGALDTLPAAVGASLPFPSQAAAVAAMAASGPPRPQDIMVLAKADLGWNGAFEVFTDIKTRVSEVVPSDRYMSQEQLVCYVYPRAEEGPANGDLEQV